MPSGITDYGAQVWLPTMLGLAPAISAYYIALCSEEPGPAMDGDILADLEPDDVTYRRRRYQSGRGQWTLDELDCATVNAVDFGTAFRDWGLISHYALCTAQVSGEVYAWGEFATAVVVQAGSRVVIPEGGISLSLTSLEPTIAP